MFWRHLSVIYLLVNVSLAGVLNGKGSPGEYIRFKVNKQIITDLKENDLVKLVINNPTVEEALFFLVMEDEESKDYWSRLNYKSTLTPGENTLYFRLTDKVGQRGSQKNTRKFNFSKLLKLYAIVDPDNEISSSKEFEIRNIEFQKIPLVEVPKDILYFDFALKGKLNPVIGSHVVTDSTEFNLGAGAGFSHIELWKNREANIALLDLNDAISVKNAVFQLSLPKGEYGFILHWDELGYWDVPFWTNRKLFINGVPKVFESRSSTKEFLKDYTRLMGEPNASQSAYEFYISKIFRPVEGTFKVGEDGNAAFGFEGDETGVSLNSLIIYPIDKQSQMEKFLGELDKLRENEFEIHSRRVDSFPKAFSKKLESCFLGTSHVLLSPSTSCPSNSNLPKLFVEKLSIDVRVIPRNDSPIFYEVNKLQYQGSEISTKLIKVYEYKYRPKSIDLNHETYHTVGDSVELLNNPSFNPNKYPSRHLLLEASALLPGEYVLELAFEQDGQKSYLKHKFKILENPEKKDGIKVGFLGLNPFPNTYFPSNELKEISNSYLLKAYDIIKESGFELFTGIPEVQISYQGAERRSFSLDSSSADQFINNLSTKEIYSYNENFPSSLLTGHQRNAGQSVDSFWKNLKDVLSDFTNRHSGKKFVYLYSDEATGYRNAVDEDIKRIDAIKKKFPQLKLGGFGNFDTFEKGKKLYMKWDYGFYTNPRSKKEIRNLTKEGQKVGLYNICSGASEDLSFCFGVMSRLLSINGIERYFEWHASAVHNYPGFDLDGREADIALLYIGENGELHRTRRLILAERGVAIGKKFRLLSNFLEDKKALGLEEMKAKKWLRNIDAAKLFPLSKFKQRYMPSHSRILIELDQNLLSFF